MSYNSVSCSTDGSLATQAGCKTFMTNFCSTDDIGQTYIQKWQGTETTSACRGFVALNTGNQAQYVPVIDAYVNRYLVTDANPVTYAQQGSLVYQPAITDVIKVCQTYPGGCDNVLGVVCAGETRENLGNNPSKASLCGCFLSDAQYNSYTGAFGTTKNCDPLCVLQSAVKPRDPANAFTTLSCAQTVCVIDNVTISILEKSNLGSIGFAQSCGGCQNGGCTCSISNISITSVESTLGGIDLSQNCSGNVNCYENDANGTPKPVPCSKLGGTGTSTTATTNGFPLRNVLIIIGIILFVFLIIIVVAVVFRKSRSEPSIYRPDTYSAPPPGNYYGGSPMGYNGSSSYLSNAPLI